jgi:hypothetical protein
MGILYWSTLGLLLLAMINLNGCFRSSPPDHFYMLRAVASTAPAAPHEGGLLVGLGPIHIPAYLDRPQIVRAASGQEYYLSDQHRWAERLDENIARVSARNLAAYLPADQIVPYPWPREPKPDAQVTITIQELHVDPAGEARMSALWTLRQGKARAVSRQFSCRQPASAEDYALMVEAQSQCLARLNHDMAHAIRNLDRSDDAGRAGGNG